MGTDVCGLVCYLNSLDPVMSRNMNYMKFYMLQEINKMRKTSKNTVVLKQLLLLILTKSIWYFTDSTRSSFITFYMFS